jgi:hypothetical protein
MTTLEESAVRLYTAVPADFTSTRSALAAEAPELAAEIKKLRKASTAAWAVNALAREAASDLDEALALGQLLREAQDDLDAATLAELTRKRRALAAGLTRQAVKVAADAGVSVGAAAALDVEKTINAAMTDAAASAAVRSGRLVRALEAGGFDAVDLDGAVAGAPVEAEAAPEPPEDELAARRAKRAAEQEARATKKAAADADRELTRATAVRDDAQRRADVVHDRIASLRAELERLEPEAEKADTAVTEAEKRHKDAVKAQRAAERDAERAAAALDDQA